MISQGEAVFQAVAEVLENSELNEKVELSDKERERVHAIVLGMFTSGVTQHKKNPGEAELKKYIPGLVNNWLRKDTRLNGGTKYVTKNPGARAGSGDAALKEMKLLLSMTQDPTHRAEIQAAIDARVAEIKPRVAVNASVLPEALRRFVQQ